MTLLLAEFHDPKYEPQYLETAISKVPNRDILLIIGDFNAKVGADAHQVCEVVGKFGLRQRNEKGDRLLQFAADYNLTISNTTFQNHPRRLYTWTSPDGEYRNQIDYILIRSRWRIAIRNAHTFPEADCGSDLELLVAKMMLKLRAARKISKQTRFEVGNRPKFLASLDKNWPECVDADKDVESIDQLWDRADRLIRKGVDFTS